MAKSIVSVVRTEDVWSIEEIEKGIAEALRLIGGIEDCIKTGDRVLLKPNVVYSVEPNTGAITRVEVVRILADMIRDMGAKPFIAESAAHGTDTEKAYASTGYQKLREEGYEVVDLKRTKAVEVEVPGGDLFPTFKTFEPVVEADVIVSLPVLKTHDQTEATLSLKNLKGLIHDQHKRRMHELGIFRGVADLMHAFKPSFTLVDGTIGGEGLGPIYGLPVEMGLILAGKDLVAVDVVGSRIMEIDPTEVGTTVAAAERGLGQMDESQIEVVGVPIKDVQRRFMRSIEDERGQVEGLCVLHAEGSCTGCRNTVASAVFDMKSSNREQYLKGLTLVTGDTPLPEGVNPEEVITLGVCVPQEMRVGRHVVGCPPNNIRVIEAVMEAKGQ